MRPFEAAVVDLVSFQPLHFRLPLQSADMRMMERYNPHYFISVTFTSGAIASSVNGTGSLLSR